MMRRKHRNILLFVLLALMEYGVIPGLQSIGFNCGDPKISHKYSGDTVQTKYLIASVVFLPISVMCSVEYGCYARHGFSKRADGKPAWFSQALVWYREYLSGLLIVFFLTALGKVLIGEPRPHFLDTCKPHEAFNCSSGYVSSYTCTNKEDPSTRVRDASRSFPSGHASLSVYFFVFSAWYVQQRMVGVSTVLVAWLQVLLASFALICSLTRITDHRHHWWDVLAGFTMGFLLAIYSVYHFSNNFNAGTYRTLDTRATKDPEKPNPGTSGRRLLVPSPEAVAQSLTDNTSLTQ